MKIPIAIHICRQSIQLYCFDLMGIEITLCKKYLPINCEIIDKCND